MSIHVCLVIIGLLIYRFRDTFFNSRNHLTCVKRKQFFRTIVSSFFLRSIGLPSLLLVFRCRSVRLSAWLDQVIHTTVSILPPFSPPWSVYFISDVFLCFFCWICSAGFHSCVRTPFYVHLFHHSLPPPLTRGKTQLQREEEIWHRRLYQAGTFSPAGIGAVFWQLSLLYPSLSLSLLPASFFSLLFPVSVPLSR